MSEKKGIDLTTGKTFSAMLKYATPLLIASIFQTLYTMVDAAVLGRFVGSDALAAIGSASSTTSMIMLAIAAVTGAVSVSISQAFGAGKFEELKKCEVNSFILCLGIGIIFGIIMAVIADPLMHLMKTPENTISRSILYIRMIGGFCIIQLFYNLIFSILRSIGDSRIPLYFLVFCSLLNIGLDLFSVLVLHLAVFGVAAATLISQFLSAAACLIYMFRQYPFLRFKIRDMKPDRKILRRISSLAGHMVFQNLLVSIGMLVVTSVINRFGSDIVAASTIGSNVQMLCTTAMYSYVLSFSVYAGQNYGAKKTERIHSGFLEMALLTSVLAAVAMLLSFLLPDVLVSLYSTHNATAVRKVAVEMIRIQASFFPFLGAIELYNALLRGIGKVRVCTISSMIELIMKVSCSLTLSALFGYTGIWYADPIGWILGLIPSAGYYHSRRWEKELLESEKEAGRRTMKYLKMNAFRKNGMER